MNDAMSFTIPFADRLPGEPAPNESGPTPFVDTRSMRRLKFGPEGCGFATSGFPPSWCSSPVQYVAVVRDIRTEEEFGEFDLCTEHAARLRALGGWEQVVRMWSA